MQVIVIIVLQKLVPIMFGHRISMMANGISKISFTHFMFALFVLLHPTLIPQITPTIGLQSEKPPHPLTYSQVQLPPIL